MLHSLGIRDEVSREPQKATKLNIFKGKSSRLWLNRRRGLSYRDASPEAEPAMQSHRPYTPRKTSNHQRLSQDAQGTLP